MTILTRLRILIFSDDYEILQSVREILSATEFESILKRVDDELEMNTALDMESWDLVLIDGYLTKSTPDRVIKILAERAQEVPYLVMYGLIKDMSAMELLQVSKQKHVAKENSIELAASIHYEIFEAGDRMVARLKLEESTSLIIEAFGTSLEMRDHGTAGHTQRVTQMSVKLARRVGFPRSGLINLYRGALLHDIGKIGISDTILLKAGALDDAERATIRTHPGLALNLLSSIDALSQAVTIPFCHHEKWDGSGYPRGLQGLKIPLEARIFSIVDVYDALTSDRPYRDAWSKGRALEYIQSESNFSFDPEITPIFLRMFAEEPNL